MKTTYIQPEMTVVRLQHQGMICESIVKGFDNSTDEGITYGGGGGGSEAYTKQSRSIWDEEW